MSPFIAIIQRLEGHVKYKREDLMVSNINRIYGLYDLFILIALFASSFGSSIDMVCSPTANKFNYISFRIFFTKTYHSKHWKLYPKLVFNTFDSLICLGTPLKAIKSVDRIDHPTIAVVTDQRNYLTRTAVLEPAIQIKYIQYKFLYRPTFTGFTFHHWFVRVNSPAGNQTKQKHTLKAMQPYQLLFPPGYL